MNEIQKARIIDLIEDIEAGYRNGMDRQASWIYLATELATEMRSLIEQGE